MLGPPPPPKRQNDPIKDKTDLGVFLELITPGFESFVLADIGMYILLRPLLQYFVSSKYF